MSSTLTAKEQGQGWLFSPATDLLIVANVAWPLLALLGAVAWAGEGITFLQLYVISVAHRWITVPLVLFERRFFPAQARRFGLVAGVTTSLTGVGLLLAYALPHPKAPDNLLIYLMMVDYVWNAWHFASQHAGIFRIYGRRIGEMEGAETEKAVLRTMALWAILRVALTMQDLVDIAWLSWFDPLFFIAPLWWWFREIRKSRRSWPRISYLGSLVLLYGAVVGVLHLPQTSGIRSGVLVAHALFHAIEYLAVCGWSMMGKRGGIWSWAAPRPWLLIGVVVVLSALGNGALLVLGSPWLWGLATLWVSYLHYAWDGMIWKAPAKTA